MKRILFIVTLLSVLVACSNDTAGVEEQEVIDDDRFVNFQYVDVLTEESTVIFTGNVATSENELYYTISQGDTVLVEEQPLAIEETAEEWVAFEVREQLPSDIDQSPDNPPIIAIYGKTEKGTEINPNYIPVDLLIEAE